ncbi:MAG: UbiA family prenyltransferase [Pseudomonadota bacterium]
MSSTVEQNGAAQPLCVDLDGTLTKTDTLVEAAFSLLKQQPMSLLKMPLWLLRGKASFKERISSRTELAVELLPYNQDVIEFVTAEKQWRNTVLVTGSNQRVAEQVAGHLGIFDEVLASDSSKNLTGRQKQSVLEAKYGQQGYDYIGNSRVDWPVWQSAHQSLVVAKRGRFLSKVEKEFKPVHVFELEALSFRKFCKAIRVHQWLKNLLIFVPLLLEHRISDLQALLGLVLCFFCLSLFASATYLINDLLDLDADRMNSTKKTRAFASGLIEPQHGVVLLLALFALSMALAWWLPLDFFLVLMVYGVTTLAYSFWLKREVMVDVCILAALFTLRIIAGGTAIDAEWSFWLLAFSMFFFLSLALGKRASEIANAINEHKETISGRGYTTADLPMLTTAGVAAGYMSVLIVALYINSDKVALMYAYPEVLWMVCPLLLYWVGRFWMIVSRGAMHEDPIVFAMRDRVSFMTVGLCMAIVLGGSVAAYYL